MSSDESGIDEDGNPIYVVHTLPWLADSFNQAKEDIDGYRNDPGLYQMRGSLPRARIRIGEMSQREPPKGLPRSFFDPEWLNTQPDYVQSRWEIVEDSAAPPCSSWRVQ